MVRPKFDGVVEAVRYASDGHIALARLYERHGAAWSDHILLGRKELVERLKKGKRIVAGQRKVYLAGMFETGNGIVYHADGKGAIVTEGQPAGRDFLAGVPVF